MADFHDQYSDTEISCEKPVRIPIDDNIKYTVKEYRQKLYDDLLRRKKEIRKKKTKKSNSKIKQILILINVLNK